MKTAAMALAGGTAIVAAFTGWELRSQWLASSLDILPFSDQSRFKGSDAISLHLPESCAGYLKATLSEGGRQQIYVRGKDTVSVFIPRSIAADIASASGWSTQAGSDGTSFYTLIGENDHCAVAFLHDDQPIVLASRLKPGRVIEFAEKLKNALREHK